MSTNPTNPALSASASASATATQNIAPEASLQPYSARDAGVSLFTSIATLYRILVRGQVTRTRLIVMFALGLIGVYMGFSSSRAFDSLGVFLDGLIEYDLGILVPLLSLMMATPMLGNLVEDRLMAYIVLKPVPRWHIAVAGLLASLSVLVVLSVIPVALAVIASGQIEFLAVAILAAAVASCAYGAVFMFLGLVSKAGLWIGLVYLVIWESSVARLSEGTARIAIRSYATSILSWETQRDLPLGGRSAWASIVIPLVVVIIATALSARVLSKRDID